jgi:pyrroline-5-carboxylate reductase
MLQQAKNFCILALNATARVFWPNTLYMSYNSNILESIAIFGGGNIGMSIAQGLVSSGLAKAEQITITRKESDLPEDLRAEGFHYTADNLEAAKKSKLLIITVLPMILADVLDTIKEKITDSHLIISIVTGVHIADICERIGREVPVMRAMPNTAIKLRESMTCIACNKASKPYKQQVKDLFDALGKTLFVDETYIPSATALGSCGIAFFLRSIRAASQGGTQIGFHAEEAQLIAAQTAKGAAELILQQNSHPEDEIDKVTTPRGVTIAGLNEMEHNGFSSALIKGIVTAYEHSKK